MLNYVVMRWFVSSEGITGMHEVNLCAKKGHKTELEQLYIQSIAIVDLPMDLLTPSI